MRMTTWALRLPMAANKAALILTALQLPFRPPSSGAELQDQVGCPPPP